jgi:recombination associated protein RdgC
MAWFSKIVVYRLTHAVDLSIERLQEALAEKRGRPVNSDELSTYGFVSPLPLVDGEKSCVLAHPVAGNILISAEHNFRKLPGRAVTNEVNAKVAAIEKETGRKINRKDRSAIKDDVVAALLPRVIPDQKTVTAIILPAQGLIVINTSMAKVAEDLLSTLREVLGSLPVRPVTTHLAPSPVMTDWLKKREMPADFFVLGEASLSGVEAGKVGLKDIDLMGDDVRIHLDGGLSVSQLALAWGDKLTFRLNDKLAFDKVKFTDVLQEEAAQSAGEGGALEAYDASMTIMGATFANFLPAVFETFGGETVPEGV